MSQRILYLDPFGGIAGDMTIAALLDLGGDIDRLRADLRGLPVSGYRIEAQRVMRGPFAATWFRVLPEAVGTTFSPAPPPTSDHGHDHGHSHDHGHGHSHGPQYPVWPGQPDRRWRHIRAMLQDSDLPARARERALAVFGRLAEAEGSVHGMPVDDVVFHEVGAVDSIIDVVGACLLLEQLGIDRVIAGAPPLGTGTVNTEHGPTPLPAPATAALLRGFPVRPGHAGREQVTPTGAALLAALAEPGSLPSMTLRGVGHGAGTADPPDHPNVLRALMGDAPSVKASTSPEHVVVLAAQMDDLSGEHLPALLQALLDAGALDAFAMPVLMKKGRSGLLVQALAEPGATEAVERAMLLHGSTFGVRRHEAARRVLDRWHDTVETPWGSVRVKVGALDGVPIHGAPEHADVQAVAAVSGVPEPRVHAAAVAMWQAREGQSGGER